MRKCRYWDRAAIIALATLGGGLFVTVGCYVVVPDSAPIQECLRRQPELLLAVAAAVGASLVIFVALAVWREVMLARRASTSKSSSITKERTRASGDDTIFRVGAVGGEPPRFLSSDISAEIAEMFSYRDAEPEPPRLDAPRTIAARAKIGRAHV